MKPYPLILILSLVYPMARAAESETGDTTRVVQSSEPGTMVVMLPGPRPAAKPLVATKKTITEEAKPVVPAEEPKPAETKAPETKLAETKPAETKPAETKPSEAKVSEPARGPVEGPVYFPKLIGTWKLAEARHALGEPVRQRPSLDADKAVNGQIYAFQDPTNRYKEVELEFAKEGGTLRAVFMYPTQMTWKDCRRLWGMNVNATEAGKGRTFYSYNNRHLDVLVDPDGKVISLGLY